MKQIAFLLGMLVLALLPGMTTTVSAQKSAPFLEGSITYERTQHWVKVMVSMPHMSKQAKERAAYSWGNNSEWSHKTILHVKNNISIYKDVKEETNYGYSWKEGPFFISRNFTTGLSNDVLELEGKYYLIQDSLQAPAWKIGNDIREVAGHICMNATWEDTLKYQKVVAWFALDMKAPVGPESFFGLPGAILSIDINEGAIRIEATEISTAPVADDVFAQPKKLKAKKIAANDFRQKMKDFVQYCIKEDRNFAWGMRY